MQTSSGFMKALKCRECGREYPLAATHVCEFDFGPLEVVYDYDKIKGSLTRSAIESRRQRLTIEDHCPNECCSLISLFFEQFCQGRMTCSQRHRKISNAVRTGQ